jgi:hypothetical protein
MILEIGKLYSCEEYYLLLYPYLDTTRPAELYDEERDASIAASYWTRQLGKPVSYLEKSSPLLVLRAEKNFYEVVAGDKKGWITFKDWLNLREIA